LTREYGVIVTRWSDSTLVTWRSDWLMGIPHNINYTSIRYQNHNQRPAEQNIRAVVKFQPIWFSTAIHLQSRLNCFSRVVMKQSNPEFSADTRISSALRYFLLVSPPFQRCSEYLVFGVGNSCNEFWLKENQQQRRMIPELHNALQHEQLCWFSELDRAEDSSIFAIYTGLCYVKADENTTAMGVKVENPDTEEDKNDEESEEDEYREEEDDENEHDGDGAMKSDDDNEISDENPKEIRDVLFTDPNLFPVFEWQAYQDGLWLEARSAHDFFIQRKVYQYCHLLKTKWDKYALAMTHDSPQSVQNSSNFSVVDDSDDKFDFAPFNHLSPPFKIQFDQSRMKILFEEILNEIARK